MGENNTSRRKLFHQYHKYKDHATPRDPCCKKWKCLFNLISSQWPNELGNDLLFLYLKVWGPCNSTRSLLHEMKMPIEPHQFQEFILVWETLEQARQLIYDSSAFNWMFSNMHSAYVKDTVNCMTLHGACVKDILKNNAYVTLVCYKQFNAHPQHSLQEEGQNAFSWIINELVCIMDYTGPKWFHSQIMKTTYHHQNMQ